MIYFYGGAFNPMTKAHIDIIKNIFNNMKDEDLMIIAITEHDYKNYDYDYNTRLHIVLENLKYAGFNDTLGSRIQLIKQDRRTWKFLNEVLKIKNNLTLVIGEDEWNDLKNHKWHYSKELLTTYKFKVIPRTDNVSSTKVRKLLKNNVGFDELQKYITRETYEILKEV